jgi:hypothetical protein
MSAMSDYLEGALINHLFRTTAMTRPTGLTVALCTVTPTDTTTNATLNEAAYTGYARATLNPLDVNWAAPVGNNGVTSNSSLLTFGTTNTGVSTTVTGFAILDQANNVLIYGALQNNKTINTNDPAPTFPIGTLQITFQ